MISLKHLIQIFTYGMVSLLGLAIDYISLIILVEYFNLIYWVSNIISVILSIIANYFLSNKFVFEEKKPMKAEYHVLFFFIIGFIAVFLNTALFVVTKSLFELDYRVAKLIPVIFSFFFNFYMRKIFLYK